MVKSVIIIVLLSFMDRGIAMFPGISFLSIWRNYEAAEHFVSLCRSGRLETHVSVVAQIILYSCIAIILIRRREGIKR